MGGRHWVAGESVWRAMLGCGVYLFWAEGEQK